MITVMTQAAVAELTHLRQGPASPELVARGQDEAVRQLVVEYYDFVWRSLRRFGVAASDVDDALQQVFMVATRRLSSIVPGSERAFLFGTVVRIASIARRSANRRREAFDAFATENLVTSDQRPNPDELLEYRRARELLDLVLDQMAMDLRTVFVLYELEELTVPEIAKLVDIPIGTVASRLRRARQTFQDSLKRYRASHAFRTGSK